MPAESTLGGIGGHACGPDGCVTLTRQEADAIWAEVQRQKAERQARIPDEASAIRAMFDGWLRLRELGWRDASYAPCGVELEVIEPGSTGIHFATRDEERRFWIHADGDSWPSRPALYRLRAVLSGEPATEGRET